MKIIFSKHSLWKSLVWPINIFRLFAKLCKQISELEGPCHLYIKQFDRALNFLDSQNWATDFVAANIIFGKGIDGFKFERMLQNADCYIISVIVVIWIYIRVYLMYPDSLILSIVMFVFFPILSRTHLLALCIMLQTCDYYNDSISRIVLLIRVYGFYSI